ncbi:hypothetical protein VCSRO91_3000 [Vibrio cholerae]|nr:hypothetical protein VCSRO91_3000 [Vibrio cholerae]
MRLGLLESVTQLNSHALELRLPLSLLLYSIDIDLAFVVLVIITCPQISVFHKGGVCREQRN